MPSVPSIVNALARGLDVPESEARQILSRVVPTVQVSSTHRWWESDALVDRPACGWAAASAVAAEQPDVFLENPEGNSAWCLVERIYMMNNNAADRSYEIILSDQTQLDAETPSYATTLRSWRDLRGMPTWDATNPVARPSCRTGYFTRVGQIDGPRAMWVLDETSNHWGNDLAFPCLLVPGTNIHVMQSTVNTTLRVGFFWRELRIPK